MDRSTQGELETKFAGWSAEEIEDSDYLYNLRHPVEQPRETTEPPLKVKILVEDSGDGTGFIRIVNAEAPKAVFKCGRFEGTGVWSKEASIKRIKENLHFDKWAGRNLELVD